MGSRGPLNATSSMRIAGTNYRDPGALPSVSVAKPRKPKWLDGDDLADEKWKELTGLLIERKNITAGDKDVIALAANAWSVYQRSNALLIEQGLIAATKDGVKKHPAYDVWEHSHAVYTKCLRELGLTPASRSRVNAVEETATDAFAEFAKQTESAAS